MREEREHDTGAAPGRRAPAKSGEVLAQRIQREIAAAGWPVGERIGTETELLQRYQVSRPVLREAVRLLEHHMVVESRRGAGGGLHVTAPDLSTVTETAALYLDYLQVRAGELYSAREVLESRCIELAVERLTWSGAKRLREVADRLSQVGEQELTELDHVAESTIAELSEDPVLILFVKVLLELAHQHPAPVEERLAEEGRMQVWRSHQLEIVNAVLERDAERARTALLAYLGWAQTYALKRFRP
jgi:DNA-binding FadR family transcriptional regulator